jgi:glutamyl endopeptidase
MATKMTKASVKNRSETAHLPVSNKTVSAPGFGKAGKSGKTTLEVATKIPALGAKSPRKSAHEAAPLKETQMLDAYWGSFGTDADRAALRHPGSVPVLEVVIDQDDRQQIVNTSEYPFSCIASLRITAADGSGWIGTGWLVGPRILLTAGHVVFMADHGGWVQQIEVIPGRNADNFPFGSVIATDYRSVQGWIRDNNSDFDYGVILLPAANRLGDQLGWFGYQVHTDDELAALTINISGYPGDKPTGTQWWMSGPVNTVSDRTFVYTIDTAGGQSGAPVWIVDENNGRYGVGVHTNGAQSGNSALRITQNVFDNITTWANEVP